MSGPSLRDCQVSANNGNCREKIKINPSETVRCEINLRSATSNLNQQNLISFHLFTACFADGKNKAKWQKGKELSFITEITFGSRSVLSGNVAEFSYLFCRRGKTRLFHCPPAATRHANSMTPYLHR